MTGTNHFLAGALLATVVPQPAVAVAAALGSHLVLDAMPHFGRSSLTAKKIVIAADAACLLVLLGMLWQADKQFAIVCGLLGVSLDLIWIPFTWAEFKRKPYAMNRIEKWLHDLQWGERRWGLLIETPFAVLLLGLLLHSILA